MIRSVSAGFTLIEMVVTITILGLVAAVALPSMIDFTVGEQAGPLEPARRLVVEARRESERRAVPVEVSLVPTSGRYRITSATPTGEPTVREGVVPLEGVRSSGPEDRFRVVFRPVGMGVGDTLAMVGLALVVDPGGTVAILR